MEAPLTGSLGAGQGIQGSLLLECHLSRSCMDGRSGQGH